MTSANTHASHQVDAASDSIEDVGTFQVLVSYYDGEDFDGDWRWCADAPEIGVASDGRTYEEALEMVKDAIQCFMSGYQPGQFPVCPPDAMAIVCAEYADEGMEYTLDKVTVSGPNPYR